MAEIIVGCFFFVSWDFNQEHGVLNQDQADPASLQNLHDIIEALPVPWWPLAPGWYVLMIAAILVAAWAVRLAYRQRKANAYRRAALSELKRLTDQCLEESRTVPALRALPELLKRTALAAWPRGEVAGLSGNQWLTFLNHTADMQGFSQGPGRVLPEIAYRSDEALQALPRQEITQLFTLAEDWIKRHRHVPSSG